jgi:murein DD-endopeptidase MepM/ murein hydrolase activator NlpD
MRGLLVFLAGAIFGAVVVCGLMWSMTHAPPLIATTPIHVSGVHKSVASRALPVEGRGATAKPPASSFDGHAGITPAQASTASVAAAASAGIDTTASEAGLFIPVEGVRPGQLVDTFDEERAAGRRHDAIDIPAPRGTRVLSVADGTVAKLFTSVRGGLTVYAFDTTGTIVYYYAHLDGYAPGLAEGAHLRRGELVGYVGSTGDANPEAPHLHFEIGVLGAQKHWWQSTAIDPYPVLAGEQTLAQAIVAATPPEVVRPHDER